MLVSYPLIQTWEYSIYLHKQIPALTEFPKCLVTRYIRILQCTYFGKFFFFPAFFLSLVVWNKFIMKIIQTKARSSTSVLISTLHTSLVQLLSTILVLFFFSYFLSSCFDVYVLTIILASFCIFSFTVFSS